MARSLLAVSNLLDLPPCALQDGRAQMRSLSIIFSAIVLLLLGSASAIDNLLRNRVASAGFCVRSAARRSAAPSLATLEARIGKAKAVTAVEGVS